MSNNLSFFDVIYQQNNGQPITIASTGTLHQSFSIGGAAAAGTVPNPMAAVVTPQLFPALSAQAKPFKIQCGGTQVGGGKYNIDIVLGTGLTPVCAATGTVGGGLANDNWFMSMECMWDINTAFLRGRFSGWAGTSSFGLNTLANLVSVSALASLKFTVALTIINANANASFSLTEFSGQWL